MRQLRHRNLVRLIEFKENECGLLYLVMEYVAGPTLDDMVQRCCRNVLIYFNETLQARVHQLLFDSLARAGFLALGRKETLRNTPCEASYEVFDEDERLFRRRR